MKTDPEPEGGGELPRLLREWKVAAPLPPRFREQVWQRIARAETRAEIGVWKSLWRLVDGALARPRFAVPYVVVVLACGVAAGSWAAQVKTRQTTSELRIRYVQSVTPFGFSGMQP